MSSEHFDQVQVTPDAETYVNRHFEIEDFIRKCLVECAEERSGTPHIAIQSDQGKLRDYFSQAGWPNIIHDLAQKLNDKGIQLPQENK
jgi:hypothetical protein